MVARIALALCLLAGCAQDGLDDTAPQSNTDLTFFRCFVQPELTRSCAFMDCHGNDTRPLRIYAEQRFRLGIDWLDFETPLTADELTANFVIVSGFAASPLLYEKPLDVRAGGLYHGAAGLYGPDDVYTDESDVGFRILRDFAAGQAATDCEPGDDYP